MTNVFDVAEYILTKTGPISAMKLQKLVYYCQAWSLVWDDKALFSEEIEAWVSGPVIRSLYELHRGKFLVTPGIFSKKLSGDEFTHDQLETMNIVIDEYKNKTAQWLSDQTHSEKPWRDAREGLSDSERGCAIIDNSSIAEYYSSLF